MGLLIILNSAQQVETIRWAETKAQAYLDGLFGLKATAGSSDINTVGVTVESTYVMQRGCNVGLPVDSSSDNNPMPGPNEKPLELSTVTLDAAAQMARIVRGSTQPGVRQIALLKHYRLVVQFSY
jgi:hypothetical protein